MGRQAVPVSRDCGPVGPTCLQIHPGYVVSGDVFLTVLDFAGVKEGEEMVISMSSSFPDRIIPFLLVAEFTL